MSSANANLIAVCLASTKDPKSPGRMFKKINYIYKPISEIECAEIQAVENVKIWNPVWNELYEIVIFCLFVCYCSLQRNYAIKISQPL